MKKLTIIINIIFFSLLNLNAQQIIYVASDAIGSNNGTSWEDAYTDLQIAITNSSSNDTIWVKSGVYKPNTTGRENSYSLKPNLVVLGGFSGNELKSEERDFIANKTVVSGDIGEEGVSTDNLYHVFSLSNCGGAKIDGFYIQDGYANGSYPHSYGGGIYFYQSGSVSFSNCVIKDNYAQYGGGMCLYYYGNVVLENTVITNNYGLYNGGAIHQFNPCSAKLINCIVTNNYGRDGVLSSYNSGTSWEFINTTILSNTLGNSGDYYQVISVTGGSTATLTNCISLDGFKGSYTCDYTYYSGSVLPGEGNITGDIHFLNQHNPVGEDGIWFTEDDGLQLTLNSPARNTGDNTTVSTLENDIVGQPRIIGKTVDMGAYEFFTDPVISDQIIKQSVFLNAGDWVGTIEAYDPDGDDISFEVLSGYEEYFIIDENSGNITINDISSLDNTKEHEFTLIIRAKDPVSYSDANVTVKLYPVVGPSINDQSFNINENANNGSSVGTLAVTNGDITPVSKTIFSGNDSGTFNIDETTGEITISDSTILDYESVKKLEFVVKVSDGNLSDIATITINLNDIDEKPVAQDTSFVLSLYANNLTVIGQTTVNDPEEKILSYSFISGNDDGIFSINSNGEIILEDNSKLDYYSISEYHLAINVSDAINNTEFNVDIKIDPTINFHTSEVNAEGKSLAYYKAIIQDKNGKLHLTFIDNGKLYYSHSEDNGISWNKEQVITGSEGKIQVSAIAVTKEGKVFIAYSTLEASYYYMKNHCVHNLNGNWEIEHLNAPIYNNNGPFTTNIKVDDDNTVHIFATHYGWWSYGGTMWEFVRNPADNTWSNGNPIATYNHSYVDYPMSGCSYILPTENSYGIVGLSAHPSNLDKSFFTSYNPLTDTWTNSNLWDNARTARFAAAYDEQGNTYFATIKYGANDNNQLKISNNLEALQTIYTLDNSSFISDIALHADKYGNLIVVITRKDLLPLIGRYSVNRGWSNLEELSGIRNTVDYLVFTRSENLESFNTDAKCVARVLGDNTSNTPDKLIYFNINDAPYIQKDTFVVNENIANNDIVGTLNAFDGDNEALTFSLIEGSTAFSINSTTGQIKVIDETLLDYATSKIYSFKVTATDNNLSDTVDITVRLNKAPVYPGETFEVNEYTLNGTLIGTLLATDEDDDQLTYTLINGNTDNAFILENNGELKVNNYKALEYAVNPVFNLDIEVSDGHRTTTATVIVNVKELTAATISMSDDIVVYNGESHSLFAETTPEGLSVYYTYNGSTTQPANVGIYSVEAVINDGIHRGMATATLTIEKATAIISVSGLNQTYTGNPLAVDVSVNPDSLSGYIDISYEIESAWTNQAPINAGTYNVKVTLSHNNYQAEDKTEQLIINKAEQIITFNSLPEKTYGENPFIISATGGASGNPVTFESSNTSVATISGNQVTITGAGKTNITAKQAGNENYNAASDVTQELNVNKQDAIITVNEKTVDYDGNLHSIDWNINPEELAGNVVVEYYINDIWTINEPINAGIYNVRANLNHPDYNALEQTTTLQINKLNQSINFTHPGDLTYGDADINLTATGGDSGENIVFTSSNESVISIDGNTAKIQGAGDIELVISQAGNINYNAASVTEDIHVNKAEATITLEDKTVVYNGVPFGLTPSISPDSLTKYIKVQYEYGTTFSEEEPVNAGVYNVIASIDHKNYEATQKQAVLIIEKATQEIDFTNPGNKTYGNQEFELIATGGISGIEVEFNSNNQEIIQITGNIAKIAGAGTCTITASQDGNQNTFAADNVSHTITVSKAQAVITINDQTVVYNGQTHEATAEINPSSLTSNLVIEYLVDGIRTLDAPVNTGSYDVFVNLDNENYEADEKQATITIEKADPEIISWPQASDITEGETLSMSELTGGNANIEGVFEFVNPDHIPDRGDYNADVVFKPTDLLNYNEIFDNVIVTININTGISNSDIVKIYIYPNPAKDILYVNGVNKGYFRIISNSGLVVNFGELNNSQININKLSPGLYYLIIEDKLPIKFIKQ